MITTTEQVLIGGPRDGTIATVPDNIDLLPVHCMNPIAKRQGGDPIPVIQGKYRRSTPGTFVWDGFDT